ncbi:unnamed protein product [Mycena citricolor]|uniref:DUF6535 domain-containing protein n=1 Tax=Mycena citricolor TaxID=2018698 RepID=A0AAD2H2D6_9AGAR|nr:unnamed protein product [Mycena citricolor]
MGPWMMVERYDGVPNKESYIAGAEKYDKAIVEGWRRDMEGLLIFAGLFSSVLTAFIIESYQKLSPDPAQATLQALALISAQLSAIANGTQLAVDVPGTDPFTPSAASVACNIFLFISLGLSLACALLATLVEQWARHFLQKVDARSSPLVRARVLSYLYFGAKRFKMHDIVEIVPMLLHLSLTFFLAGLIALLRPINSTVMIVSVLMFVFVLVIYCGATVLPLKFSDCPYRTPLTHICWRLYNFYRSLQLSQVVDCEKGLTRSVKSPPNSQTTLVARTMTEVMVMDATQPSVYRTDRDLSALRWTVKSLSDNDELAPFVERLPLALWGPRGPRPVQARLLLSLVADPETDLIRRMQNLLDSGEQGLLESGTRLRRKLSVGRAVSALARLCSTDDGYLPMISNVLRFDTASFFPARFSSGEVASTFSLSLCALLECCHYRNVESVLRRAETEILTESGNDAVSAELLLELQQAISGYQLFIRTSHLHTVHRRDHLDALSDLTEESLSPEKIRNIRSELIRALFILLSTYILRTTESEETPDEFDTTCSTLRSLLGTSSADIETCVLFYYDFKVLIDRRAKYGCDAEKVNPCVDAGMSVLLAYCMGAVEVLAHNQSPPWPFDVLGDKILSFCALFSTPLRCSNALDLLLAHVPKSVFYRFMSLYIRGARSGPLHPRHNRTIREQLLHGLFNLICGADGAPRRDAGVVGESQFMHALIKVSNSAVAPALAAIMTRNSLVSLNLLWTHQVDRALAERMPESTALLLKISRSPIFPALTAAVPPARNCSLHPLSLEALRSLSCGFQVRIREATLVCIGRFLRACASSPKIHAAKEVLEGLYLSLESSISVPLSLADVPIPHRQHQLDFVRALLELNLRATGDNAVLRAVLLDSEDRSRGAGERIWLDGLRFHIDCIEAYQLLRDGLRRSPRASRMKDIIAYADSEVARLNDFA